MKEFLKRFKTIRYLHRKLMGNTSIALKDLDLKKIEKIQQKLVEKIKKKDSINVCFFISTVAKWKYDYVYRAMLNDDMFEPIIVVVPMHAWGKKFMKEEHKNTYDWFGERGYNVIGTYIEEKDTFYNVKKYLKPDIVFYSEPYNFVGKEYYITNFYESALCCHSQYSFMTDGNFEAFYNQIFHNMLWAFFAETDTHKGFAKKYALNEGSNVITTGYPACDVYIDKNYKSQDIWKVLGCKNNTMKRVVWAPHHTLDEENGWANFLSNHDNMISIAKRYKEKIFFVFKPHPNLKPRLYSHENWGKEKTDSYFAIWRNMPNSQITENDYVDLFIGSDALILDSGSFILEYFFTKKPMLYLYRNDKTINTFNSCAQEALENSYKSFQNEDIVYFIENVVLGSNDYLEKQRVDFLDTTLMPPNNVYASTNIVNHLKKTINKSKKEKKGK